MSYISGLNFESIALGCAEEIVLHFIHKTLIHYNIFKMLCLTVSLVPCLLAYVIGQAFILVCFLRKNASVVAVSIVTHSL